MFNPYFTLANAAFMVGSTLMAMRILKNYNALNDFDFKGTVLTSMGMMLVTAGYISIGDNTAALTAAPTLMFWLLVVSGLVRGQILSRYHTLERPRTDCRFGVLSDKLDRPDR